jgi:YD repeat-containing protein
MMSAVDSARWLNRLGKAVARAAALVTTGWLINGAIVHPSAAQIPALPQPAFTLMDENDVDSLSFTVYPHPVGDVSIGSKEHPLTHSSPDPLSPGRLLWPIHVDPSNCGALGNVVVQVALGVSTEYFSGCTSPLYPLSQSGSILTYDANGTYRYTKRDGTTIVYPGNTGPYTIITSQIVYPDGRVLTYGYFDDGSGAGTLLRSVTRSDGLQLKYTYSKMPSGDWRMTSVTAINNAYEYCNPTAVTCSLTRAWPTANYSYSVPASGVGTIVTITDAAGRVARYTYDARGRTVGIKLPSSATADNITYTYCDSNCPGYDFEIQHSVQVQDYVRTVIRDGQTWSYSGNPGSPSDTQCGTATYTSTNPVGASQQATLVNCVPGTQAAAAAAATPSNPLIQVTDRHGVQFVVQGTYGQFHAAIKPEGGQTQYAWGPRGNIYQETVVPKSGSPLPQVTMSANYDLLCDYPAKCNKANWIKDGLGNQTDYTYDTTHGGMLTVTLPADVNGIRPQTRSTYAQRYAWVLNASGAYVRSAAPIWVLATESFCRTSTASASGCTVAGDQVTKTYEYGPDSGPNNLFLRGVAVTADGVTHRTCYGYDPLGNQISETAPAAGLTGCP